MLAIIVLLLSLQLPSPTVKSDVTVRTTTGGNYYIYHYALESVERSTIVAFSVEAAGPITAIESPPGWTSTVSVVATKTVVTWVPTDSVNGSAERLIGFSLVSPAPAGDVIFELLGEDLQSRSGTTTGPSSSVPVDTSDFEPPIVSPPSPLEVSATDIEGTSAADSNALAAFLSNGAASDNNDPVPVRLVPQVWARAIDSSTLFPLGTTIVTFRFGDAAGNVGSATATVTVRLTPTITWADPSAITEGTRLGIRELNAETNVAGTFSYAPPPHSLLNAGTHTLTATFAPSDFTKYATASKNVTITVLPTAGEILGMGFTQAGGLRHEFDFRVKERATGAERGRLRLVIERTGQRSKRNRDDEFVTTGLAQVIFSDDPRLRPSQRPRPTIDTASFTGTGRWNQVPGYTFTAEVSDAGEPGRGRDLFAITVRDPKGIVVANVTGAISGGNIQSSRLQRR